MLACGPGETGSDHHGWGKQRRMGTSSISLRARVGCFVLVKAHARSLHSDKVIFPENLFLDL